MITTSPSLLPVNPAASPRPAAGGEDSYLKTMFLAGVSKNAMDVTRAAIKLPEAARSGQLAPALAQTLTASPTSALINPNAPRIASAASGGKSFTLVDEVGYRATSLLGVGIGAFQVISGVPHIAHAIRDGGARALYDSREGRTGALQAAGGALTLGAFTRAGFAAKAAGVHGAVPLVLAAATAPSLTSPVILGATIASSALVLANDHGFLDFMNRGDRRPVGQVERQAWQATGINEKVAHAKHATAHAASSAYGAARGWVDRVT